MSVEIILKGIAWDHPRGYEPLRATSKAFSQLHPKVKIEWDIRSLKEFGDMPIEDLIDAYDLITIDHPYMGQAYADQLLLPLQDRLTKNFLKELERQSVGPSFRAYYFDDQLLALPIDVAALVAASRNDLISRLKLKLPQTRQDLFDFYKKVPKNYSVAWPLCPTDLWCTFLTLCAQDTNGDFIKDREVDEKVGANVMDEIKHHLEFLHPSSITWNPIQVLDSMGATDEIVYAPFLFGYTNYSRKGYSKNLVHFSNSPVNPDHSISTILGGVGLAISSKCQHADLAVEYTSYVAKAEIQEGMYTQNGGQPGNLAAWEHEGNNEMCNNFFSNTLKTMQNAYVRPQHQGWNRFQEQGADLLHNGLLKNTASAQIVKELNQLYQSLD
ncbi:extracellular solute-binding protein [Flagellimonas nanhaiensis]|uniref:Extracellular solute-binding protein n=1 Tax=Flagellimonas nanhaiensis TaxID=2292706 RepID=A0A371JTK8_9FLAO|nr:extracellular solute-binding protein [Allomuricauda nanhaiensis]RDY61134.1 extracellular solute-binding protein [Allomuricauda nanhaiensis]